jgi:hypothetical protein
MKRAALLLAAVFIGAWPTRAQNQPATARVDPLVMQTLQLEKKLAAQGIALSVQRFSIGTSNRVTAYLDPRAIKKIGPSFDKNAVCNLLAQYVNAAEKLRQAYSDGNFNDVVYYHAKALLAQDLISRLSHPGPVDASIGDKTIIIRYRACREVDWEKEFDDLPLCDESLLSYYHGSSTDPLDQP